MKRLISIITLLGLTLSLATGKASANVTYTFLGVTFVGDGTLTGTFTTNDAIMALVDFDITTSPAPSFGLDGFHYTPATSSFSNGLPFSLTFHGGANVLQLSFGDLSAAGSPINIVPGVSLEQTPAGDRPLPLTREIVAGQVVVVPEPESYAMVLAGLGLLGLLARHKKQQDAA